MQASTPGGLHPVCRFQAQILIKIVLALVFNLWHHGPRWQSRQQVTQGQVTMGSVTVQFEITTARRGQLTTTVKERTFKSETALERWCEKMAGNVTILRYLSEAN